MFVLESLDPATPFPVQLQQDAGPIVLINTLRVPEGTVDQAIQTWQDDATLMRAQPGFVSAVLHRGIGTSRLLVNVSVWESTAALQKAFSSPAFQEKAKNYPEGTVVYPHVFQRAAVVDAAA